MLFDKCKQKVYDWFSELAHKPSAKWWLALISFTESSFFPIPPDPFLLAALIVNRSAWFLYSSIVAVFSVLGGIFGYAIGFYFFHIFGQWIVDFYGLESQMQTVAELFQGSAFLTVFMAAFTPIPYKLFTIAAGLFQINFVVFVVASLLGRGIRFLSIGYIMKVFGKEIGKLVFKYFNILTGLLVLVVIVYFLISVLFL